MPEQKFYKLKEVKEILNVSERTMHRLIHDDRLKATKVGNWRINKSDLDAFLKKNSNTKKKK